VRTFLGIDIGGTNIKAALVSDEGAVLSFRSKGWPGGSAGDAAEAVVGLAGEVLAEGEWPAPEACGAGVAGLVNADSGVVHTSPNLPEWKEVGFRQMLSSALGMPVRLENDANAAAYAEYVAGAARGARDAIVLTLGTGVGGGIVLGGRLHRGSSFAGEVGHMTIEREGRRCPCGNTGCLERYTNAESMVERASLMLDEGRESVLRDAHARGELTSRDIGRAAAEGDAVAAEAIRETGRALGVGLANLAVLFDPELIVLGGGVAQAGRQLFEAASEEMKRRGYGSSIHSPKLLPAELEETAGAVGAALLARDEPTA
jgi:glucokinase